MGTLVPRGQELQGCHLASPASSAAAQPGTRAGLGLLPAELGAALEELLTEAVLVYKELSYRHFSNSAGSLDFPIMLVPLACSSHLFH